MFHQWQSVTQIRFFGSQCWSPRTTPPVEFSSLRFSLALLEWPNAAEGFEQSLAVSVARQRRSYVPTLRPGDAMGFHWIWEDLGEGMWRVSRGRSRGWYYVLCSYMFWENKRGTREYHSGNLPVPNWTCFTGYLQIFKIWKTTPWYAMLRWLSHISGW